MSTTQQKIDEITKEMDRTQKNKATNYHLGLLRAKLAKLRRELIAPSSSGGGPGVGFDVARSGIATCGLIGFPSVGKSTLMSGLTGVESLAAAYEFTTLTTIPGEIRVHGAPIQLLDLPGIIAGAKDGKGRGRQVIAVARSTNMLFIVLDVSKPLADKAILEAELEGVGIRINKRPPQLTVKKKERGGLMVTSTVPMTDITHDEIRAVCSEYKLNSCDVHIKEAGITVEDLIDVIEGNRVYMPVVYVLNKIDAISIEELDLLYKIPNSVPISSRNWWNIDELLEVMWDKLDMVRIYTRPKGKTPDYSQPVVLRRSACSVEDFCNAIHSSIAKDVKFSYVWGTSVRHSTGQRVGLTHVLQDEDIVTLVKR